MPQDIDWIVLIYSLPSQPSRKRAYVWRELKKLGALYLRDGVVVLPRLAHVEERLREVVERIDEYEGSADLILSPCFAAPRDGQFVGRFQEEREQEYRELYHACVRFLRDVLHEVDSDDFGFPDVDNLESELGRLHRWHEQIAERDYFKAPDAGRVQEMLEKCDRAFERFVGEASERPTGQVRAGTAPQAPDEDVFERLGGPQAAGEEAAADLPL